MKITPYSIHIPNKDLQDLRSRLERTRWPDEVTGAGWAYGANLAYMQELIAHWLHGFDWRKQEEKLNSFPQFRAEVDGIGIHFVHLRGQGPSPIPLILTHGWPSSFYEMLELARQLADDFDVIVPSLPGFGFSDIPTEPGMGRSKVAALWVKLMEGLGYVRFGVHGNDIGAVIHAYIARDHPDRLIGLHTMMPTHPAPAFRSDEPPMSLTEERFAEYTRQWDQQEGGYNLLQATRPQTLAYGLNDSPVGLAAWIIEKWRSWGTLDGDLDKVFSWDDVLTNVAVYWLTQTANSSGRSYYERAHDPNAFEKGQRIHVPTGVALSLEPVQRAPREWVERVYTDIRRWTEFDHGGHFMAIEDPQALAGDIREFFRGLRS